MAPVTSHDSIRDILYNALSKRITRWKRADSDGGSKPNNTGYVAAIAILSAIIVGYMLYKAVRWYAARHFARTGRPIRLLDHKRAARRMSKVHQEDRQNMIADISVTEANASYNQFPSLGSAQSNEFSPSSAKQFLPLSATGPKTPKLEWRPPTLNSWSKFPSAGNTPTPSKLESGATDASSVSYPTQAHAEQGRKKEKRDFFSFVKGRGKADAYDALTSPPPGELQARIENDSTSTPPVDVTRGRQLGGAISPPLPPLPPPTPAPLRRKSTRKAAPAVEETESSERMSKEMPSRPASRATTVTVKGSRLTNASIDFSQRRTSAVPSPRVSSLYRSRLSSHSHSYTPASPNLPHPPVPPMPSLPAFLLAQQQASNSLNRSSSVRTTASTSKNTDSMGSIPNNRRAHDTAASSTLLPDSTVPPSVASSDEMVADPTKGPDGLPLPRTMVVTATFTPSLSDELPITIGETVSMLEEYIDGWCFVQRVRVHLKPGVKLPSPTEELVDPEDTIVVPVEGEGNSGAVPRFCVSEWPLPAEIISHLQAQHNAELAGQKAASTPEQASDSSKGITENAPTQTLQSFLPSPIGLEDKSPMMSSGLNPTASAYPPSTTMMPLAKKQEQRKGVNDFAIPTPSDVPDSKFSSWGSAIAPSSAKMPGIYGTMQANTHINATPPVSASSSVPPFSSSSASSTAVNSGASTSHALQSSPAARHAVTSTLSSSSASQTHTSDSGSASTSRVVSVVSQPAPAAPPASPATSPTERDQEEDDGIKRVSKPPLAPRLSRFPTTAGAHDELGPEEEFDPRLLQHMKSYTDASKPHVMDVPRASDRTVTMPPLSRKLPTVSADPTAPPVPDLASSNVNGFQLPNTQGARAPYGYPTGYGNGLPSAMSSAMDTGMGTSVGSKTPSTSNTHARSGSITKRFTSFATGGSARERSGSVGMGGVAGPRPVASSSSKGTGGPGVVSFKALRTGSSTANVGVVGR